MFECIEKESQSVVTVYGIDFAHDAFLIDYHGKFKLVSWSEFIPLPRKLPDVTWTLFKEN